MNGDAEVSVPLIENQSKLLPYLAIFSMITKRMLNGITLLADFIAYVRNSIGSGGISFVAVTDLEYPERVVRALTLKIRDQFFAKFPRSAYENATKNSAPLKYPELKDLITEYQTPEQADPLMRLQKELDDTVFVMHKSINSVLQRGEKIDDLVAKSEDLSTQSKMFYTQVKDCIISMSNQPLTNRNV